MVEKSQDVKSDGSKLSVECNDKKCYLHGNVRIRKGRLVGKL